MSDAEEAYRAAERLIAEAKADVRTDLSFDGVTFAMLSKLPPEIADLTELRELDLDGTRITDDDLSHISALFGLERLGLSKTAITDTGLGHISGLSRIKTLILSKAGITDAGLSHLSAHSRLQALYLDGTLITGDGLSRIAALSELAALTLTGTRVTDRGLSHISKLVALSLLFLNSTQISDEGVNHILGLAGLRFLAIDDTKVTDLRPILALENLEHGGISYRGIPALDYDLRLERLSEIRDHSERTRETFAYLREVQDDWPPIPRKAPAQDDLLRVEIGEDGRLDVLSALPGGAELTDTVKGKTHLRLKDEACALAQAAGNRFPRLAAAARGLGRNLDCAFEDIDMLGVHFDLERLRGVYERRGDGEDDERLTQDVIAALDVVLIVGPGLVLDNAEVEKLEARRDRYRGAASPTEIDTQDAISDAIISNPEIFGDQVRAYSDGFKAGSRHEMDRLRIAQRTMNRNTAICVGLLVVTPILGGPLAAIGNDAVAWLALHHTTLSAALPGWGEAMQIWLTPVLMRAREMYLAGKSLSGR